MDVGVSLTNANSPLTRAERIDCAEAADRRGLRAVIMGESTDTNAFMDLTEVATRTEDVELVVGIANVFSRTPALLAMSAATLDAASDGRGILGLGAGSKPMVSGFHGLEFERPVARVEAYLELVRAYWSGEPVNWDGPFVSPSNGRLTSPPETPPPLGVASLGPRNLRVTGANADVWMPHLVPRSGFALVQKTVEEGAEAADRDPDDIATYSLLPTVVHEDEAYAAEIARHHIAAYIGPAPSYRRAVVRGGFEDVAEAVHAAWERGDREAAREAVSRDLVDETCAIGTPERVHQTVDEWHDAGVEVPILHFPKHPDTDVDAVRRALAVFGEDA